MAVFCAAKSRSISKNENIESVIEKTIAVFVKKYEIPGVAITLYVDQKPYLFHFGYSDKKKKIPVTSKTLFEIGSISKLFTCLLVAQEVLSGSMQLNVPISTYIPLLSSNKTLKSITLEELCTHTSGLPCDISDQIKSKKDLLKYVSKCKPSLKEGKWSYSNTGIELLRIALEELSGQTINSLLINKILVPLTMLPVGVTVPDHYKPNCAKGYDKKGKQTIHWDHPFLLGSAALRVSSVDMLNFLKAAIGLSGTPSHIKQAMQMTQTPYVILKNFKHGLGWQITPLTTKRIFNGFSNYSFQKTKKIEQVFNGNTLFDKVGTTHGFHAYIAVIPSYKAGIVVMMNRRLPNGARIINEIGRDILFKSQNRNHTNSSHRPSLPLRLKKK
jgi:beta-lactamase class C